MYSKSWDTYLSSAHEHLYICISTRVIPDIGKSFCRDISPVRRQLGCRGGVRQGGRDAEAGEGDINPVIWIWQADVEEAVIHGLCTGPDLASLTDQHCITFVWKSFINIMITSQLYFTVLSYISLLFSGHSLHDHLWCKMWHSPVNSTTVLNKLTCKLHHCFLQTHL